jgi:hypothetical protein
MSCPWEYGAAGVDTDFYDRNTCEFDPPTPTLTDNILTSETDNVLTSDTEIILITDTINILTSDTVNILTSETDNILTSDTDNTLLTDTQTITTHQTHVLCPTQETDRIIIAFAAFGLLSSTFLVVMLIVYIVIRIKKRNIRINEDIFYGGSDDASDVDFIETITE